MYAAATIVLCAAIGAPSAQSTLADRIAARHAAIADATTAERATIVEQVLDLRAQLIREHPDDPHQPVWLADQAQDLFYLVLPAESSGLVTRFGLPTRAQLDRARRVARDMHDLADRAEMTLEQLILDTESGRGGGLDQSVLETERNRRIPFLRGIAACLHADFNVEEPRGRKPLYAIARSRLEPVSDLLPDRFAATAQLYAGLAMLGVAEYDAAAKMFRDVSTDPLARRDDVFAARMALVRCRAAADLQDALNGLDAIETDELLFRVLVADERFRLLQRQGRVADAFGAYLELGSIGFPRLVRVAGPDTPLDRLPLLVTVARAGNLAATPGRRAEAIELYERLLGTDRLDETAGAATMFGLARAYLDANEPAAAVRQLTTLASMYPASAQAEPSIELAASLAAELNRVTPGDAGRRALLGEVLQVLLGRYPNLATVDHWRYRAGCLALDEQQYENAIRFFETVAVDADVRADALYRRVESLRAWTASVPAGDMRRMLARRLMKAATEAETANPDRRSTLTRWRAEALLALDDPAGALAVLPTGDNDEFAVLTRIEAYRALGRRDEMTRELQRLVDMTGPRAGAALVAMFEMRQRDVDASPGELLPLAQAATHWLETHGDNETLQLAAADAYRLAGQFEDALELYDKLFVEHPNAMEVLYGRAECLFNLGGSRDKEAMEHYRRLAFATATKLDDHYWQSQLRMLQILRRSGRNTHRIAPYVRQLRGKDPDLGGQRYRREFERLLQEP